LEDGAALGNIGEEKEPSTTTARCRQTARVLLKRAVQDREDTFKIIGDGSPMALSVKAFRRHQGLIARGTCSLLTVTSAATFQEAATIGVASARTSDGPVLSLMKQSLIRGRCRKRKEHQCRLHPQRREDRSRSDASLLAMVLLLIMAVTEPSTST